MNVRIIEIMTLTTTVAIIFALSSEVLAEESGEIPGPQITFHEDSDGVRGIKLRMFLKTDPERLWNLVTDSKRAPTLFKNVASITPSSKGPRFQDYHISSIIGEKIVTCRVTQNDARRHLSWKRVEGSLESLYGYFKIGRDDRYPDHVRFDYGSFVDPGGIGRALMTNRRRRSAVQFMITKIRSIVG